MNRHTLRVLEFEKIRLRVRERCLTHEASQIVRRERVETDAEEVSARLRAVDALKSCLGSVVDLPVLTFPPVAGTLEHLAKEGVVLEALELAEIASYAKSSLLLWEYLGRGAETIGSRETAAMLGAIAGERPDVADIGERLSRYVDPDGSIRERDIPELKSIRAQILRAQQELQKNASALANRDDLRRVLSATVPTQRDGRTVLALKADHRGKLKGIVHEISGSGATVFVEPEELVERNNAVTEAESRYRNELLRILRELTIQCRTALPRLEAMVGQVVAIDLLWCRARFSRDYECEPASVRADSLVLRQARHPLLGDGAVPINVEVPAGKRVLIVTGPNTGGKTVTLKTVGLLALMNQFGLEVPAGPGTELPIFDGVFADVGDEQSIEQNLSTFSGHMRNISRILNNAGPSSLILLDELGSGTDPEEGGALAMAILDELLERGPLTVVTTHHGRLKHFGFTHERAINASVEFDAKSLRPTYHIIPGVPGSSHAVEIAAQMGVLRSVTGRARDYLAGEEYDTGRIIRRLTDREQELHLRGQELEGDARRLAERGTSLAERAGELDRREAELRSGRLRELEQWSAEARSRLENLVREIREGELTREKTQSVKGFIAELDQELDEARKRSPRVVASISTPSTAPIEPGSVVRTASGKEGTVQRRGKGTTWLVQLGPVRLPIEAAELTPVSRKEPRASVSYSGGSGRPEFELDLRGFRLEDALDAVERQIDQALLAGMQQFGIIHGTGEGILQKGVRDMLQRHPHVSAFDFARPEDGGFGKTNVTLS